MKIDLDNGIKCTYTDELVRVVRPEFEADENRAAPLREGIRRGMIRLWAANPKSSHSAGLACGATSIALAKF